MRVSRGNQQYSNNDKNVVNSQEKIEALGTRVVLVKMTEARIS